MKSIIYILSAILLFGAATAPVHANATNDTEFVAQLVSVFNDCQKIKPGMTRAELIKLQMFDQDFGPLRSTNDKVFRQHTTFQYQKCALVAVDVDFAASAAQEAQPTDVITKVSLPYIDARPRR